MVDPLGRRRLLPPELSPDFLDLGRGEGEGVCGREGPSAGKGRVSMSLARSPP